MILDFILDRIWKTICALGGAAVTVAILWSLSA
jgi:hypothetical protein